MGGALARQLAAAGHEVRVGSRDPERGRLKAAEAGAAFGGTYATAAANAEVVVLAVPFGAAFESLAELGYLDGTVVVDVTNQMGEAGNRGSGRSCAEQIQDFVPEARVVKAWNHLYAAVIRRSADFGGVAATVFVAGDDADAKQLVSSLARDVGYDPADAGPITSARYLEPLAELMTVLDRLAGGERVHALKLLQRERPRRRPRPQQELLPSSRAD
jgi:predicted dinucleotide-binding enzyme